jgi:hypothetical protein
MNFHYFTYFKDKWDPYGIDIIGKTNYIRNKLSSFEVTKPIVVTESCRGSNPGFGTYELQAQYVPQLYARSKAAGLDFTVWWWLWDWSTIESKCGLLMADGTPKPAWDAYQTLAAQLTSTEYARTLPATETGSSQIEAYEFRTIDGSYPILVAWTNDGSNRVMSIQAEYVVVIDKQGNGAEVRDGDDGNADGRVQVTIGPSPQYVRIQSEYRLTIATAGAGTVQREPDKTSYHYGELVTLTSLPAAGWAFDRWTGLSAADMVDNGDGSWSLTMNGDKAITAVFRSGSYTIAIDILGEGAVHCLPTGPFWDGEVVRLTPVPDANWVFDTWLGPNAAELVDNKDGSWSLTMNGNKAVTARFLEVQDAEYYLSMTVEGQGRVGYLPGPYYYGELATLIPVPAEGWSFGGWHGVNGTEVVNNGDHLWLLRMNADKAVTAYFSQDDRFSLFFPVVPRMVWP